MLSVLDILRADLPHLTGRRRRFLEKLLMVFMAPLLEIEEGEELLASVDDPVIFALNHNNSVESVLVPTALVHHRQGRLVHFLVDWMFIHLPVAGFVIRQCEPVPVYTKPDRYRLFERYRLRKKAEQPGGSPLAECALLLGEGKSVGLFPEGTRNRDAETLRRGRVGLGHLVLQTGVPVVPVGIHYPAADRLGRMPKIGRFRLRVGEPLHFDREVEERRREAAEAGGEASSASRATDRRLARRIVDTVMARLAQLSEKSYPHGDPEPDRTAAATESDLPAGSPSPAEPSTGDRT